MIAADELYLTYFDKATAYVRGKVDDPQDVEDLVSTAFLKIYQNLSSYDPEKASLSTWVYTIVRNTVTDYYRTRKIHISYDEACEFPAPTADQDILEQLADALLTLKEKERDLIILHYYKGYKLTQIADMMEMSYINTKVIHKNALNALHRYFKDT